MSRQFNIRSEEAYERATRIARRIGLSPTEVVVRALRKMELETVEAPSLEGLSPELRKDNAHFAALAEKARTEMGPLATSNHDELYDAEGLPR